MDSSKNTIGPIRNMHPCKDCPDKEKRPACRKGCQKDAEWHKELEKVNGNRIEYNRLECIRNKRYREYGGKK